MATRNINLTDALDRFVAEQIEGGGFQNASEVVRAGLRLLKDQEETRRAKLAALNAAIQEGLDDLAAGRYEEIDDIDAYFDKMMGEIDAEVAAEEAAARTPAE